ncbi:glycosyltransferase family 2 protein [Candidatus Cardinium hertigii]|uniref:Glycosyltransferase family 2 protein n=1 Tax=Candidatus Cardinium hertigii TaxID=247481 RepID=A0A3N2QB72_9BACT|nr:glycosyltransferase family 2 protein [Candidatus Cardinium hertigii]ROT47064.1 glycosyltransferase family 2 protein [Candidatus Cardinium hertigii]
MLNYNAVSVAIVLLNYNGLALLKQYLPTLLLYSNGHNVIVVDNASTDGSVTYLQSYFPEVLCMVHDTNYGIAKGYNLALRQIKATYYLLLNNDVLVTEHWLSELLAIMEADFSIAFCQPKILSIIEPDRFDYAGAAGGFIDADGYPFCRGRIFNSIEKDRGQYDDTRAVFWASGACVLVRSKVFHDLGGFDELFFAHFEEIDMCWRAHLSGWKVYYCGTSKVYHLGGATIAYSSPRKTYLNFRNRALMLYKYQSNPILGTLKRLFLDVLAAFRMLYLGKFSHSWAICKAQIDFFKFKKKCMVNRSVFRLPHIYKRSIVVYFFIKKNKLFSKISSAQFT